MALSSTNSTLDGKIITDSLHQNCVLVLYCFTEDVYDQLERAGTFENYSTCVVFHGIHDAVLSAVESNSALYNQVRLFLTTASDGCIIGLFCCN